MSDELAPRSARIITRQELSLSPWVRIVRKEVEFAPGQPHEVYHCLAQADYIAVLAQIPGGLIPIVRQYRPAVEAYTWELPAGLLEAGEDPEEACRRELWEETGLVARSITHLGSYYADSGRFENLQHVWYVRAAAPNPDFAPESGMSVRYVDLKTLKRMIVANEFRQQLHIAALALYEVYQEESLCSDQLRAVAEGN